MAEAMDYVHPIIQALVESARLQAQHAQGEQQKVRDTEAVRAHQAEEKQRADALKQAMEIANRQHDIQQKELDLRHSMAAHTVAEDFRKNVGAGIVNPAGFAANFQDIQPNPQNPMETQFKPGANLNVEGVTIPAASVPTQGQMLERFKQIEEAKSEPIFRRQTALFEHQNELDKQRANEAYQRSLDIANLNNTRAETIATQARTSSEKIAAANNASRERAAALRASVTHGVDPNIISSLVEQGTTGQTDLSKGTSPAILAARAAVQQSGQKLFGPKEADALKQAATLNGYFDQIKDFANTYLSDSKIGAIGTGIAAKYLPTEAKDKLDQLKTNALNAGKALEGITAGRVTNKQLDNLMNGLASVGKPKSQVIADATNLQNRYKKAVNDIILGGFNPAQRAKILETHGLSEDKISGTGTKSGYQDYLNAIGAK